MAANLKPSEKEEKEVQRLTGRRKPRPHKKKERGFERGPDHSSRRRRMKIDDPDLKTFDEDLSLRDRYSSIAFNVLSVKGEKAVPESESGISSVYASDPILRRVDRLQNSIEFASKALLKEYSEWLDIKSDPKDPGKDLTGQEFRFELSSYRSLLKKQTHKSKGGEGRYLGETDSKIFADRKYSLTKKLAMFEKTLDKYSKTRFSKDFDSNISMIEKIWNGEVPGVHDLDKKLGSLGARAGVLQALKKKIDSFDYPKSVTDLFARDASNKKAQNQALKQYVNDFGKSFTETDFLKTDFMSFIMLSAIYRKLSLNPSELNKSELTEYVDKVTHNAYDQVQELVTLGEMMETWTEAAEKYFGDPEKIEVAVGNVGELEKIVDQFLNRKEKPEDLISVKDIGSALADATKRRFNTVPKFLQKFASSQSSYKTVSDEMIRTSSYHGIVDQHHPEGPFPGWNSIDKRYLGKSHFESIVAAAKEFLKDDWCSMGWDGGMSEAPVRAALDLAIATADGSIYQSKIDSPTYEMLLNRLTGQNQDLFTETRLPGTKRSSSVMNKAVHNMLSIASDIRNQNPRMALDIVKNLRHLVAQQQEQAQQQQQGQQEQQSQQQGWSQQQQQGQDSDKHVKDIEKEVKDLSNVKDIGEWIESTEKLQKLLKKHASRVAATDLESLEDMDEKEVKKFLDEQKKEAKKVEKALTSGEIDEAMKLLEGLMEHAEKEAKKVKTGSVRVNLATLVRVAFENPDARPVLLPIIAAKKKSMKKESKKASPKGEPKKDAKKASPKAESKKEEVKEPKKASPKKKPAPKKEDGKKGKKPAFLFKKKASVEFSPSDLDW